MGRLFHLVFTRFQVARSRFAITLLPDWQLFIAGGYEHSEERECHNDVHIGTVSVA